MTAVYSIAAESSGRTHVDFGISGAPVNGGRSMTSSSSTWRSSRALFWVNPVPTPRAGMKPMMVNAPCLMHLIFSQLARSPDR